MDELVRGFKPQPGVRYTYTALNDKGRERARAFTPPLSPKVHELSTRVDMCDVFAQRNTNRTQAQQIASWPKQIEKAVSLNATEGGMSISNAWGSNWTGEVSFEDRMNMLDRMYRMWADAGITVTRVGLSDAMSWNMPRVETLEQAQHFIRGPKAYEGAPSPWKAPIASHQRPDSLTAQRTDNAISAANA